MSGERDPLLRAVHPDAGAGANKSVGDLDGGDSVIEVSRSTRRGILAGGFLASALVVSGVILGRRHLIRCGLLASP